MKYFVHTRRGWQVKDRPVFNTRTSMWVFLERSRRNLYNYRNYKHLSTYGKREVGYYYRVLNDQSPSEYPMHNRGNLKVTQLARLAFQYRRQENLPVFGFWDVIPHH